MKKLMLLVLCLSMFSLVFANGDQEDAAPEKLIENMTWDEIVEQAKIEGEVTWFQWYLQPEFRDFVTKFEEKYGIKVTVADGSLDGNMNKLISERGRETGDIDVLSLGGDTAATIDLTNYFVGPLTSIIPGGEKLRTKIMGADTQGYAVAFWGNQVGLAYDSTKIEKDELPQTMEELGQWIKDNPKMLGFNVENGGSGPHFVQAIVRNTVTDVDFTSGEITDERIAKLSPAWDWLKERTDFYVLTASNADSLTRLNDGEFILVPAWEDHLAGLQNANAIDQRVKFYIPRFGMTGGGNVVGVPANAPHKAAAILFTQWLTSSKSQANLNEVFGSAPQHPGASSEHALIPIDQRAFSVDAMKKPYCDEVQNQFVQEVVLY